MTHRPTVLIAGPDRHAATRLTAAGYLVDVAADGVEALARATAAPPAVVVAACQMRGLSGLELSHRLRASAATAGVPVVLLADVGYALSPAAVVRAGVRRVLGRPATGQTLRAAVDEAVEEAVGRRAAA